MTVWARGVAAALLAPVTTATTQCRGEQGLERLASGDCTRRVRQSSRRAQRDEEQRREPEQGASRREGERRTGREARVLASVQRRVDLACLT